MVFIKVILSLHVVVDIACAEDSLGIGDAVKGNVIPKDAHTDALHSLVDNHVLITIVVDLVRKTSGPDGDTAVLQTVSWLLAHFARVSEHVRACACTLHISPRNQRRICWVGVTSVEETTFAYGTGDRCCEEFSFSASTPGNHPAGTIASILLALPPFFIAFSFWIGGCSALRVSTSLPFQGCNL